MMIRVPLLLVLLAASVASVAGEPLEIKGLRIGMTQEEVSQKFPSWGGFTVAGTTPAFASNPADAAYYEGKLDRLYYYFKEDGFEPLLQAFREKYPDLQCDESTVSNRLGATFKQVRCRLSDGEAMLNITRFVSDLNTSSVSLTSLRLLNQLVEKANARKKDI